MDHPDFDTILIANRGEIALRIIRTARRMGYRTIAVYSDADRDAPHCRAADLAMHIGGSRPAESYLRIDALVDAARQAGAQAIHPGYGFLAENAEFAQACADAGLIFIGPPAPAIRAMGNKMLAKRLMKSAGVPCIPGYHGDDQSDGRMFEEAVRIGFPVMIKAIAGGGGRGMRRVDSPDDFTAALHSARSEAEQAFASREVLLEKAIGKPRHIEIQICADMHGNVVHLGERDCSVQRRHQKLFEETPSPAVSSELRARMGDVAVAAARAIEYVGAGTLEFLLDRDGSFHFMEMNTRLQVEHAVTEAVVGVDLVEWQLRVARGEKLPLTQSEIDERCRTGGHAIEARLCAEDPQQNFLPQCGTVARWRVPAHVRTDHALEDGAEISLHYDSMVAKIVAHGNDRRDAIRRLTHALDECLLLGIRSNRHFLSRCAAHPEFLAGNATTEFIDTYLPAAERIAVPSDKTASLVACILLGLRRMRMNEPGFPDELYGWSSAHVYPQAYSFVLDGEAMNLQVAVSAPRRWDITVLGERTRIDIESQRENSLTIVAGGRAMHVEYVFGHEACYFRLDGVEHEALDTTYMPGEINGSSAGGDRIVAPMTGRIAAIYMHEGESVKPGQPLMVIEAMKMEHSIAATLDGRVRSIFISVGEQVAAGRLLMELDMNARYA